MSEVSVVIASYKGKKFLEECLESVLAEEGEYQVVVVDDGSKDGSVKWLEEYKKDKERLKTVYLPENRGAAEARNIGVANSQGEHVLFLDVDTQVKPGAIDKMRQRLVEVDDLGAVQAKLETEGHFMSVWGLPYEVTGEVEVKEILGGRTAGLMVKREVFEEIGGFDSDYKIYGEDTDLCWRIWWVGKKVELVREAKVDHQGKGSLDEGNSWRVVAWGAKNSVSNVIKNAAGSQWWMLMLLAGAWGAIGVKKLVTGRWREVGGIIWGWGWNILYLSKVLKKRREVKRAEENEVKQVMFGPLGFGKLLSKAGRWWREV